MTAKVNRPHLKPGPKGDKGYEAALIAAPLVNAGTSIRQAAFQVGADRANLRKNLYRYGLLDPNRVKPKKRDEPKIALPFRCVTCGSDGPKAQHRRVCVPCHKEERAVICSAYYWRVKAPFRKKRLQAKAKISSHIQSNTRFLSMPLRAQA